MRDAVGQVNPNFFILQMMTQSEEIDRTIYQERLVATLSALFGMLALACIGLYGLVAYGVARRTHEIGVRMAFGARRHEILWLTARLGLVLTVAGIVIVIGLGVAAGVTRYLQSLLYGVRPTDPWTFAYRDFAGLHRHLRVPRSSAASDAG